MEHTHNEPDTRDDRYARGWNKLKEIDEQDKLIRPGQVIVDLGSAPGSWSQYARNKLAQGAKRDAAREGGIDGTIIALDLLPMEPIADVTFIQGDFREDTVLHQLEEIVGEHEFLRQTIQRRLAVIIVSHGETTRIRPRGIAVVLAAVDLHLVLKEAMHQVARHGRCRQRDIGLRREGMLDRERRIG